MTRRQYITSSIAIAAVLLGLSSVEAQGVDRIKRRNGVDSGKITKVSQLAVTISRGSVERNIPVEEITSITFAGEPKAIRSARLAAAGGRYADALESLSELSRGELKRNEVKQEFDFLLAFSAAKMALAGQGKVEPATAEVRKFLTQNRESFHLTEAIELLGDLQSAAGDPEGARKQYAKLGRAPSPYHKARSAVLIGMLLQSQKKHAEAIAEFERAIAAAADDANAKNQKLEAMLLTAISRSASGDVEQSAKTVKKIIAEADPEDTKLLARAYNALGDCFLASNNPQAARDAFLHVDLLFASASADHAKALYELSRLWGTLGNETRARDARQRLEEEYPASPWTKR